MKDVRIHNRTRSPLSFNGHVRVEPKSFIIFNGTDGAGVHGGTRLHNDEGIFDDFEIEQPISDLYYGIISDIEYPVYQGDIYQGEKYGK